MKGILGRKIGMTQVFTTDGVLIPVTVVEATENVVLQKKTVATDGYDAVKVGFEDKREKLEMMRKIERLTTSIRKAQKYKIGD